jgi:hypothetical protein
VGALVAVRSFVGLVSISAFTILVYYGLTNLAALRLTREERLVHPAVPWTGLAFCLALAAAVPPEHLAIGSSILRLRCARQFWTRRAARRQGAEQCRRIPRRTNVFLQSAHPQVRSFAIPPFVADAACRGVKG